MIRFKLHDEHSSKQYEYYFEIDFIDGEDFIEWSDEDFDMFMEQMECGQYKWCGVHDGTGGIDDDGVEWFGYSSYEIKDFSTALEKWKEFFKIKNKLI